MGAFETKTRAEYTSYFIVFSKQVLRVECKRGLIDEGELSIIKIQGQTEDIHFSSVCFEGKSSRGSAHISVGPTFWEQFGKEEHSTGSLRCRKHPFRVEGERGGMGEDESFDSRTRGRRTFQDIISDFREKEQQIQTHALVNDTV
jgi:hypothetical protein